MPSRPQTAKPQPSSEPCTDTFFGFGEGSKIRGTTELYLPSLFAEIDCEVSEVIVELVSLARLRVTGTFHLHGDINRLEHLYKSESWKMRSLDNLLKAEEIPFDPRYGKIAPILQWLFNPWLKVSTFDLRVESKPVPVYIDQTPDFIFMPNSYPPLVNQMPPWKNYSYFEAKTTSIYAPLVFGVKYSFEAEIDAFNPLFLFALLFPFRKLSISRVRSQTRTEYGFAMSNAALTPVKSRVLPEFLEGKLGDRQISMRDVRAYVRIANPFRETNLVFGESVPLPTDNSINFKGYSALELSFVTSIPANKDMDVIVTATKSSLPIRIYEQLQKIPGYMDSVVSIDVFNLSRDKTLDYEVSSEMLDFSNPEISNIVVHPIHTNPTQEQRDAALASRTPGKSRVRINHAPRMKRDVFQTITKKENATLLCKVRDRKTGNIVYQETNTITILPKDFIIWSIKDVKGEQIHRLNKFIGAWITPTDSDGLLDKVRGESARYHPQGYLGGANENRDDESLQIKAIYDYLSAESGIKYVNQPFYFGIEEIGQRVLTAVDVLRSKCGNCIDLVVLFASLMEGLGINPLIMLMPGHAFLGWGNRHKTAEMDFLECTALGVSSFAEAQVSATKSFQDNFLLRFSSDPLPNELTYVSLGSEIIALDEVRGEGISGMN